MIKKLLFVKAKVTVGFISAIADVLSDSPINQDILFVHGSTKSKIFKIAKALNNLGD